MKALIVLALTALACVCVTGCYGPRPEPVGTRVHLDLLHGVATLDNNKDTSAASIHAEYNTVTHSGTIDIQGLTTVLNTNVANTAAASNVELLKEAHAMNNDTLDKVGAIGEKAIATGVKAAAGGL